MKSVNNTKVTKKNYLFEKLVLVLVSFEVVMLSEELERIVLFSKVIDVDWAVEIILEGFVLVKVPWK